MDNQKPFYSHRTTQKQKDADDKAWYKYYVDLFTGRSYNSNVSMFDDIDEKRNMQIHYNLYNNIININDFNYICKPYGNDVGELPANFVNRDISSGNIKVMLGLEIKRPFAYRLLAVNEDATTRKEQEQFDRIREYTNSMIMMPIMEDIQMRAMQEAEGRELTPEEQQQIQQQVEAEIKTQTPEEVKRYIARDHQDPAEVQGSQLLEYFIRELNCQDKFNNIFKHGCISGYELGWVGIVNGKPAFETVNPLNFSHDASPDLQYVEDSEWAVCTYYMTPSKIVEFFNDSPEGLTDQEIDDIYALNFDYNGASPIPDSEFRFDQTVSNSPTVPVVHTTFKSLRKIGFLTYLDENEQTQEMLVDETYKLDESIGDIEIKWEWIPEAHEGYNIANKFYKKCRPVPGQYKDLNNLYKCKLPYYGAVIDNMNSEATSPMARMVQWQYLFNICLFRIEQLMASDKGKQVYMNIGMVPKSLGIGLEKFMYYTDATKIGWMNPAEEGAKGGSNDISQAVKEIDLSMASDIQKYIMIAEYCEKRCGLANGITDAMRGLAAPSEAVTNNQMNFTQSSYIIEPYFELHNQVKRNILTAILEMAKVAYAGKDSEKLAYVSDDLTQTLLNVDLGLLDSSTFGLFVANSGRAWDAKQTVQQLSLAAMQNNKAELSDIIKVIRCDSVQEAEELLEVAEENARERDMKLEQMRAEEQRKLLEQQELYAQAQHERDIELIIVKEEQRRETELQKQVILSMGFNEDKDLDKDGVPDVLEVYKAGVDAEIKMSKQKLDEQKFAQKTQQDKERNKIDREKIAASKAKSNVVKKGN